jgi:uncharacterized protein
MSNFFGLINLDLPSQLQNFITLVLAICVEAFPFIVVGVLFSTIVELWVPTSWIQKNLPKNRIVSHFLAAVLGFFIPVCECGNVPFVRKMMQKGFSVSQSITFLLSAPIVNPIVWITTAEAFNIDRNIATIRVLSGLFIAMFLGLLFSFKKNPESWLDHNFASTCDINDHEHNHHEHHHHDEHNHHEHLEHHYKNNEKPTKFQNLKSKLIQGFNIFHTETWQVMQMLLLGAVIAASIQTFVPRQSIILIGQNPILSVISMLVLAFVVSMCSNVDAFFALSLSNSFTLGAIMTFMVFGPMIDIKVLAMLKQTFRPMFMVKLALLVAILSVIIGFGINIYYPQTLL